MTASNNSNPSQGGDFKTDDDRLIEVVHNCQSGQRDAMQELYELCSRSIHDLMVRMVGRQDAADLTQQVFLQVYRKIDQFRGNAKFQTWLYRLAINESLQFLRKNKNKQQELNYDPLDSRPSSLEQQEARDLLQVALGRLEPLLKTVFILKETRGLSYQEIAEATDIPEGTVGSRLNRARRLLREHLVELGWEQKK